MQAQLTASVTASVTHACTHEFSKKRETLPSLNPSMSICKTKGEKIEFKISLDSCFPHIFCYLVLLKFMPKCFLMFTPYTAPMVKTVIKIALSQEPCSLTQSEVTRNLMYLIINQDSGLQPQQLIRIITVNLG